MTRKHCANSKGNYIIYANLFGRGQCELQACNTTITGLLKDTNQVAGCGQAIHGARGGDKYAYRLFALPKCRFYCSASDAAVVIICHMYVD